MADWLDKTFSGFDKSIFSAMHELNKAAGGFFNGFAKFVSFFGEIGWAFIALAFVFLFFKRTRKEVLSPARANRSASGGLPRARAPKTRLPFRRVTPPPLSHLW